MVDTYLEKFHHGITALDGYGGYSHHPVSYLTAVVSSYEVGDVLEALKETDPKIIVSVTKVENFIGRFIINHWINEYTPVNFFMSFDAK